MNQKQFDKYLRRDGGGCLHCGNKETAIPQHRANRKMGGSKLLDKPSNIIAFCSEMNGMIESDAELAQLARQYGWKLDSWQEPSLEPVWYATEGRWYLLDDFYERSAWLSGK